MANNITESSTTIPAKKKVRKPSVKNHIQREFKKHDMNWRKFLSADDTYNTDYISVSLLTESYNFGYEVILSSLYVDRKRGTIIHGVVGNRDEYEMAINRLNVILDVTAKLIDKIKEQDCKLRLPVWSYKRFLNGNEAGSDAACAAISTDDGFEFILRDCSNSARLPLGNISNEDDRRKVIKFIHVIVDGICELMLAMEDNYLMNILKK